MNKLVMLLPVMLLCACMTPEDLMARKVQSEKYRTDKFANNCSSRGLFKGTDPYAVCMHQEDLKDIKAKQQAKMQKFESQYGEAERRGRLDEFKTTLPK